MKSRLSFCTLSFLTLIAVGLVSCASSPSATLEKIRVGMDKDEVLEVAGNPKRTFRENMQDHWIYLYFDHDREFTRTVTFEEGHVTKISNPAQAKEAWLKDLEKTKSLEEYEQKVREHQKKAPTQP